MPTWMLNVEQTKFFTMNKVREGWLSWQGKLLPASDIAR